MENVKTAETYYTVKEAAEILKTNTSSIYQLVKTGRLRAARIGKRSIRIPASSFDALLSPAPAPAPAKPTRRIITKIV
ncbi:helix-turn-helix domain-containing protein [Dysosmobacter sp. HCP28S3_G4]|uniref:helix-turn-helix domain-containing protein n=1 Tax=Dysosmobacter sp. HCP28S3_G4 TaxID=3438938 RepID=UPI003F8AA87F